ncbi:MAG: molecular chaperone TorD family protein [Omnitrophica bacterium]|nr:molecular chaperone TorD family protein [Candidatus Omnitrophota bacterium]
MKKETFTESVSANRQRLLKYKIFSAGFSYPGDDFFKYFPQWQSQRQRIIKTYDLLFRNKGIWLYTTEYTAQGTFQRAQALAEVMGFYKAFGLEMSEDRPDSLFAELEFMHYLIFKKRYALNHKLKDAQVKADLCYQAQGKFFWGHLYPGAKAIAQIILKEKDAYVYKEIVQELLKFLGEEKKLFQNLNKERVIGTPEF